MLPAIRRAASGTCLVLLLASALGAPGAVAQESLVQDSPEQASPVPAGITEDAAVALVRDQTDGKVVRVDRKTEGGRLFYSVRVLSPDGRLREYRVDAATGTLR